MELTHEMLKAKNPYNIQIPEKDDEAFNELSSRIFRCEKGDRAMVLLHIQENENIRTIDSDILTLDVWQSIEFPHKQLDTWHQLWTNYYGTWQQEKLKSVFSNEPITVYRGGPANGYSWTTNKDVAKWFSLARGMFKDLREKETGVTVDIGVWERTVTLDNVVAMFDWEDEVILREQDAFDWQTV